MDGHDRPGRSGKRPIATYRLQLNKSFTLHDAAAIAPYLHTLGITHLYLSPIFESAPGSNHGYDALDFTKISGERGGIEGFETLMAAAGALSPPLRIILDIVPNHMAAHPENPYWRDVLKNGRASPFWTFFDMRVPDGGKIEIPILGTPLHEALENGDIILRSDDKEGFACFYHDARYPLSPATVKEIDAQNPPDIAFLLEQQAYRFVPWTAVQKHVSYRRFFSITELIGVRIEEAGNYRLLHGKINELVRDFPLIAGVRVDHIDGLADPAGYLRRLSRDIPDIWVEKIVARDETLGPDWPVHGTTGYEFIDQLNRLFIEPEGFRTIENFWKSNIQPRWESFEACVHEAKSEVIGLLFAPELERLVALAAPLTGMDPAQARDCLKTLTVALPVYRTYIAGGQAGAADESRLARAAGIAETLSPGAAERLAPLLAALRRPETDAARRLVCEWQQFSGPVMAKGLEDTAHYRYTPLAAMNEVGCEPVLDRFSEDEAADRFLDWMSHVAFHAPLMLKSTSTHDTKRAEDARGRLYALSGMPGEWIDFVREMGRLSASQGKPAEKATSLLPADSEYLIYQTLVCSLPPEELMNDGPVTDLYIQRVNDYFLKARREARLETRWLAPDKAREAAGMDFIRFLLTDARTRARLRAFTAQAARAGALCSLAAQTLKILSPGIPDLYQGTESWDFSLVDPDNRRPVDYETRKARLDALASSRDDDEDGFPHAARLLEDWTDGRVKLWLTRRLLEIRRDILTPLTQDGALSIKRLPISGTLAGAFFGYRLCRRQSGDSGKSLTVVLPRFPARILPPGSTAIALQLEKKALFLPNESFIPGKYYDLIARMEISPGALYEALNRFPVAVLADD